VVGMTSKKFNKLIDSIGKTFKMPEEFVLRIWMENGVDHSQQVLGFEHQENDIEIRFSIALYEELAAQLKDDFTIYRVDNFWSPECYILRTTSARDHVIAKMFVG
jgi:hypothetical protein